MKRPVRDAPPTLTQAQRRTLALRAVYLGSPEHKDERSWLGIPEPRKNRRGDPDDHRQNATICPLVNDAERDRATEWVRHAIRHGQYDQTIWAGDFPRKIWYREANGSYWYGRLMQQGAGEDPQAEYKGWPIDEAEWNEDFGRFFRART